MTDNQSNYFLEFANHWISTGIAISDEGMKQHQSINGASGTTAVGKLALKVAGPVVSSTFRSFDDEGFTTRDAVAVGSGVLLGIAAAPVASTAMVAVGLSVGAGLVGEYLGEQIYNELTKPGNDLIKPGNFRTSVTTYHVDPKTGEHYKLVSQITDEGPIKGRLKTWVVTENGKRELVNDVIVDGVHNGGPTPTELQAAHNATTLEQAILSAGLVNPELLLPGFYEPLKVTTVRHDDPWLKPYDNPLHTSDGARNAISQGQSSDDNDPHPGPGRLGSDRHGPGSPTYENSSSSSQASSDAGVSTGSFTPSGGGWAGGHGSQNHGTPGPSLPANPDYVGVQPVILDLTGSGIEITQLSQSTVFMDATGDGLLNRTAWAAEGNGVLFYDPDNTGEISEKRQYVFTEWDPTATSDIEALRSVFDSNGDGVFDASDADREGVSSDGFGGQRAPAGSAQHLPPWIPAVAHPGGRCPCPNRA